jgi:hypothetical protein
MKAYLILSLDHTKKWGFMNGIFEIYESEGGYVTKNSQNFGVFAHF